MYDINSLKLSDLQPSQLFISEKKLEEVNAWFDPDDLSRFEAIPVKMLDGLPVMTDGHTRAAAALLAGCERVPLVWDTDELDWDMYRRCVKECRKQGISSPRDLLERIIPEEAYEKKWNRWCDVMQAEIIANRGLSGFALIEPTMEYDREVQAYRQEILDKGGSMDGCGSLRRCERTQDWIDEVEDLRSEETKPPHMVTSTQFIYVRKADKKIVGMIQIRHYFNDYLEKYAGHIGYSVCHSERRKGYATQMLKAVLPVCRALGIDRVLITCIEGNEGSRRTILHNGGVYESSVYEAEMDRNIERYWIDLTPPLPR